MKESHTNSRHHAPAASLLSVWLLLATSIAGLSGCDRTGASTHNATTVAPTAKDVVGLTEAELRAKYPEITELDAGFSNLVSKNLHPYHPPATNKLLRFGRDYLVAELKDGRVIALHRVSG
jgi:hypothetical protein